MQRPTWLLFAEFSGEALPDLKGSGGRCLFRELRLDMELN